MENQKYDNLLKSFAELVEEKDFVIDTLSEEINRLNEKIKNLMNTKEETHE